LIVVVPLVAGGLDAVAGGALIVPPTSNGNVDSRATAVVSAWIPVASVIWSLVSTVSAPAAIRPDCRSSPDQSVLPASAWM